MLFLLLFLWKLSRGKHLLAFGMRDVHVLVLFDEIGRVVFFAADDCDSDDDSWVDGR